ncbi:MAG: prephenate dehydrogenase/arogenate dehydrogenase family protein [Candidatus Gastranaerophilales bacterium]|nr:prephenate dehydrogenase/arogenate dehydrogenase family protein [Candidatus Gastranaerophilales bacterium]
MAEKKLSIGIIGLGLIGGSILKGLQVFGNFKINAFSANEKTIQSVNKLKNCHAANNINILKDSDVIFICTPIHKIIEDVKNILPIVKKECIIADVASLKEDILNEINESIECKFIGTHPMAGTENSGFEASFSTLFEDTKWVIIPSKWVTEEDVQTLTEIIKTLNAQPLTADAKSHDKAAAIISHTPMLISQAIFAALIKTQDEEVRNLASKLASSGFKDMTRLALSNTTMASDMLKLNKDNINEVLESIHAQEKMLMLPHYFHKTIEEIIEKRLEMYSKEGKNRL